MKYPESFFKENINNVLKDTNINIGKKISGKVRDSYVFDGYRLLVATDRLSAFDRILTQIPFKGEILTKLSLYWFAKTKDIIQNHVVDILAPNAVLVKNCKVVPLEVIVRGYLTGSIWRSYAAGESLKDIKLPKGLKQYYKFPKPIVGFTTKAAVGDHDEPVSCKEILDRKIVSEKELDKISETALLLYTRGNEMVNKNDLILVDTKYEFGKLDDELILVDEIHTQDSSRYILKNEFEKHGIIKELDKEYFRKWLMERNYKGDGEPPEITEKIRIELIIKYIEAYKKITSSEIELVPLKSNFNEEIRKALSRYITK